MLIDYQNMLNQLNVSGVENDDSSQMMPNEQFTMNYPASDGVNDELIEDIQKRLELLDEFK